MNVQKYGRKLIKKHLPDWKFGYHSHTKNLARTSHRHKEISLHKDLNKSINPYVIRNLLKHEIAHAKSSRSGHGKTWQREANKLKTASWAKKKKLNIAKTKSGYYIQD